MAHGNVLSIQNDQWFLPVHREWLTCLVLGVYLRKQIIRRILRKSSLLFLLFKNSRLSYLVAFVPDVRPSASQSLQ